MKHTKRMIAVMMALAVLVSMMGGCGLVSEDDEVDEVALLIESVENAIMTAGSVEASIYLDMQAHIGTTGTTGNHTASVESDITVLSTFAPYTFYIETFSRILVDSVSTREDTEIYIVPENNSQDYVEYEYDVETDTWNQQTLSRSEVEALSLKCCLLQNWEHFFRNARLDDEGVTCNDKVTDEYVGKVDSSILQELINDGIFGSFLYSVEQLLNDELTCTVYIDQETYLPVQIIIDFSDEFIVTDMSFDSALLTVDYSEWGQINEISVPKKVSVVATDKEAEFYASYYAWNLFLPYLQTATQQQQGGADGNVSFTSSWETFQIRIDNGMTALPIVFEDLAKLGYSIDGSYDNIIIEPNMYVENIPVLKGRDLVYCVFYNDTTEPQPISSCKIGSFDFAAANQQENRISVFLPGEVCLGMTKESLLAAYDDPDETISSFSSDTLIWRVKDTENQFFLAEISPVTNLVIRLQLTYIPVTGGKQ